ncbi:hypothetical protein DEU38_113134 [Rhodococcus sp. AG1013]|nr:hypothetical protein DEU38_113134 [Rhodococcus sp. AG1013]
MTTTGPGETVGLVEAAGLEVGNVRTEWAAR